MSRSETEFSRRSPTDWLETAAAKSGWKYSET